MVKKIKRRKLNWVLVAGFSLLWGIITGVLWAYANPFQLVPGIIQWRTFAFLPAAIGILVSPTAGFVSGYIGAVVWSVLAHTFMAFPGHVLVVDGLMSGLMGWIPAMTTGRRFSLAQMAAESEAMVHAGGTAIGAAGLMVAVNSGSFAVLKVYSFGWALLWFGLSMLVPVALGTPFAVRYGSRMVRRTAWVPTERF
jgi:energy-coupling factor transport system substrate-specific component